MRQTLTLKNEIKQLVQTKGPENIIDLSTGRYPITEDLRIQLFELWPMEEYEGDLILEVTNG